MGGAVVAALSSWRDPKVQRIFSKSKLDECLNSCICTLVNDNEEFSEDKIKTVNVKYDCAKKVFARKN